MVCALYTAVLVHIVRLVAATMALFCMQAQAPRLRLRPRARYGRSRRQSGGLDAAATQV